MKNKYNVGIIGLGYVGSACKQVFSKHSKIHTYDIREKSTCHSIEDLVSKSDIIFICVPTPMNTDGSTDLSIIYDIFTEIDKCDNLINKHFCIKSTIPVGTCSELTKKFENCNIIFNPEFLREKSSNRDFENQNRIILGGTKKSLNVLYNFYKNIFENIPIIKTDYKTAELAKYFTNSFLATKVSFANEIYTLCDVLGIDYADLKSIILLDNRIVDSHLDVPGHDGKKGFSGSCFPKDLNSLIHQYKVLKVKSPILNAVWERNYSIDRKNRDWEDLANRKVFSNRKVKK